MKVLHITPNNEGYEEVTLLANEISETNHLAAIEKDGKVLMTGGFIITDTARIRAILDSIPKEEQHNFIKDWKMEPFVALRLDPKYLQQPTEV